MSYLIMLEYEVKMAQLADDFRAGRIDGQLRRRHWNRFWAWLRHSPERAVTSELIFERVS